ncbi:MAG: HpcH/HpaI aldolase/citrate lyase family protein [Actinomycetota bacterium]|nr:HpcH/HpaI aldolase/citrate lyase family protein [Actinomycetota bacterium]
MLDPGFADRLDAALADDDAERARRYPSTEPAAQPVHTVYVPADRISPNTPSEWGNAALAALDAHGPLPGSDEPITALVQAKLSRQPIEDLRIDLEDGYGIRPDEVEDADARVGAEALVRMLGGTAAPTYSGVRIKSLEAPTRRRSLRSLDLFLDTLLAAGPLPGGFRITLPKVTSVRQVTSMVELCSALEQAYELGGLRFELQVETPQAIIGPDGTALVARMIHAAAGRCAGLHYGTYDYSASLGIAAAYQSMEHPAADHAKAVMQVAAAGTGVPVCDGSTNVLPFGDTEAVRAAWAVHGRLVRRSLERGYYQGWDLHPAQLPTRFAATFAFYRDGAGAAAARLQAYRARQSSGVLDEPATARALENFLHRGIECGAVDPAIIAVR